MVQNKKDNEPNVFGNQIAARDNRAQYFEDLKANIITFEYTYKLAENTRLRLGFQNSKTEAKDMPDIKANLYYTEIYSRF